MDTLKFDFLSIGIATLLYVIIHFTWYSKWLFGEYCTALPRKGLSFKYLLSDFKKSNANKKFILQGTLGNFVLGALIAYFLSFFEGYLNVTTVADGMFVAFCAWLGFVVPTEFSSVIWQKKTFRLFFIDAGANLLSFVVMGGIIGA